MKLQILDNNNSIECDYGCGQLAIYVSIKGRYLCTTHFRRCPGYIRKQEIISLEKTGYKNVMSNPKVREKIRNTSQARYGSITPFGNPEILKKSRDTVKERYGVDNIFSLDVTKDKIKESITRIYGVDNISKNENIKKKKISTCNKNYGVDNPTQSQIIKDKTIMTNIEKFGYPHPLQNPEFAEKILESGLQTKKFIMPSGEIYWLRGLEPIVVTELLNSGYLEKDIILRGRQKPVIRYKNPTNGKISIYYPDIFIPRENKIIEVKSTYTYEIELDKNLAKRDKCIELGYTFEFYIR